MGMGTRRRRQRQEQIWIAHQEVPKGPAHPFYAWVNELLEEKNFDEFAEKECAKFYADSIGRPSLAPGIYFRLGRELPPARGETTVSGTSRQLSMFGSVITYNSRC